MIKNLLTNKKGIYLFIGIVFVIIGYITESLNLHISKYVFFVAIYFLGYFCTKEAMIDTFKNKRLNVDMLMILAALGAILIDYESEGAMLLLIFAGAEYLEEYISNKSSSAISELMNQVPDQAILLKEDGSIMEVDTESLQIGDVIVVSKGNQLPIDGIIDRDSFINESALTGESLPIYKSKNDEVFAGTINEGNSFHLTVTKKKEDTVFSNIIRMVKNSKENSSEREKYIDKIESKFVTGVVVIVPLFIFTLYYFFNYSFTEAFYRGMVLLTVSSPCALVASATPATLSAISNAAKNGILLKKGKALEVLSDLSYIATDKTGTLTYGEFEVVNYKCSEEILKEVVYIEQNSNHPIAKSIIKKFNDLDISDVKKDKIEEIAGSGLKRGEIIIGKPSIFEDFIDEIGYFSKEKVNNTISLISKGNKIVGYIELSDTIRENAKKAIAKFNSVNIKVEMLTGDNEKAAAKVAKELGVRKYTANCFPEDKVKFVKDKKQTNETVAMIGDGINDAPALANSDIGISMGSGSSIAIESSDIVIVKNDLNKLYHSYILSKKLKTIIYQNLFFSMCVIIVLILFNVLGYLDLPKGVIFHEGSTILVILNGLRLLYFKGEE